MKYESLETNTIYYYHTNIHGSAQDYLEVAKMVSDRHTYNIFQSINQSIKIHSSCTCTVKE